VQVAVGGMDTCHVHRVKGRLLETGEFVPLELCRERQTRGIEPYDGVYCTFVQESWAMT